MDYLKKLFSNFHYLLLKQIGYYMYQTSFILLNQKVRPIKCHGLENGVKHFILNGSLTCLNRQSYFRSVYNDTR